MTNHRDKKLDSLIGKNVTVIFNDGSITTGVLTYIEKFEGPYWLKPGYYHVADTSFRKSHVKVIVESRGN
jgi:hypothetical protein